MQTRQRHLTIIEANHPAFRRHSISGISNLLPKSYASQFALNGFDEAPKKLTLRESEALIKSYFERISYIIEDVDKFMVGRL